MSGTVQLRPPSHVLLANTLNATPRTSGELRLWSTGDPLQAADLNSNFLILQGQIGNVAAQASATDPAVEEITHEVIEQGDRIDRIEEHLSREATQVERRNMPLAALGALKKQLDSLQGPLQRQTRALQAEVQREDRRQGALEVRLQALERKPEPPTAMQFQTLLAELQAERRETATMHRDVMRLREEVYRLRPVAQAYQQVQRQRQGHADHLMAALGQLSRRVDALERPHQEAQLAAAQTQTMRAELQTTRQESQAASEKGHDELLKLHNILLERIEALEKRYGTETNGAR